MKIKGSRRLIRRLGLALAVAAVFAPSAQAIPLDVPPRGIDSVLRISPHYYNTDDEVDRLCEHLAAALKSPRK